MKTVLYKNCENVEMRDDLEEKEKVRREKKVKVKTVLYKNCENVEMRDDLAVKEKVRREKIVRKESESENSVI